MGKATDFDAEESVGAHAADRVRHRLEHYATLTPPTERTRPSTARRPTSLHSPQLMQQRQQTVSGCAGGRQTSPIAVPRGRPASAAPRMNLMEPKRTGLRAGGIDLHACGADGKRVADLFHAMMANE